MRTRRKRKSKIHIGARFGKLVVYKNLGLFRATASDNPSVVYYRKFRCRCDCGNYHTVWASSLYTGSVRSCGCLNKERERKPRLERGEAEIRMVIRSYYANAKNRGTTCTLNRDQMLTLLTAPCHYCGMAPSRTAYSVSGYGKFIYNGIDRVDNTQGYTPGNVVTCCMKCNTAKGTQTVDGFLKWIERIYVHSICNKKNPEFEAA